MLCDVMCINMRWHWRITLLNSAWVSQGPMSSAPPKPTLGILEDHTSCEFKQWSSLSHPKCIYMMWTPLVKSNNQRLLNGFLTQLTWFKRRSAPATWSPVLGGVQWPKGRPSVEAARVARLQSSLLMIVLRHTLERSPALKQSAKVWAFENQTNNEKMCQEAKKRNKNSLTLAFGGWKMKRAHSHLNMCAAWGKLLWDQELQWKWPRRSEKKAQSFTEISALHCSHRIPETNKESFRMSQRKNQHIEFIESKNI